MSERTSKERESVDLFAVIAESAHATRVVAKKRGGLGNGEVFAVLVMAAWKEITGDESLPSPIDHATKIIEALAFAWDQGFDPAAPSDHPSPHVSKVDDDL